MVIPPVATTASPSPTSSYVGTEALFWAPNPLGGCGAVIDTTLTAPSWAPAASIAADEPSERSQRPLAASHPHDGWDALDNVNDSEVAGVPTRTALASVGRNAKTNCCAGGANSARAAPPGRMSSSEPRPSPNAGAVRTVPSSLFATTAPNAHDAFHTP